MSSKPFITEADVSNFLIEQGQGRKPKEPANVPSIRFDVPPLTTEAIVKSVSGTGGPWRSLTEVICESIEDRRAKKLSDLYDRTEIPQPEFETREFGI